MKLKEMTPGEKRAYAQGKEVTSYEQMAVCYLCARASVSGTVQSFGHGIGSDLSIECGMSPETFRRTCNKFELIMKDLHEDEEYTHSEIIYSKILNHHSEFSEMKSDKILEIAQMSFTIDSRLLGQSLYDAHIQKTKKYSQVRKRVDESVRFKLLDLYNALKKNGISGERARDMSINRMVLEFKKDKEEIVRAWNLIHK